MAAEERPMAAVMLDHEETNEQARRGHCQQQTNPMAADNINQHQSPDDKKGYCCDHQLENAARYWVGDSGQAAAQTRGFLVGVEPCLDCFRIGPPKPRPRHCRRPVTFTAVAVPSAVVLTVIAAFWALAGMQGEKF